jgi:membrane protein YdbS with pleckstrin-like domain
MALVNCPECGREVSEHADACPRCACPVAKMLGRAGNLSSADSSGELDAAADSLAPTVETAETGESGVWKGSTSQLINIRTYFFCGLISAFIVFLVYMAPRFAEAYLQKKGITGHYFLLVLLFFPAIYAFGKWLVLASRRYEITSERLKITTGVFSKHYEVLELYRVKDMTLERPFLLRLFGLGNIVLLTSDKTQPEARLLAIRGAGRLLEELRHHVEARRLKRGVREIDME